MHCLKKQHYTENYSLTCCKNPCRDNSSPDIFKTLKYNKKRIDFDTVASIANS